MIHKLIGAKLRSVKGGLKSKKTGRMRAPIFIGLSVVFWTMLYRGSLWIVSQPTVTPPYL